MQTPAEAFAQKRKKFLLSLYRGSAVIAVILSALLGMLQLFGTSIICFDSCPEPGALLELEPRYAALIFIPFDVVFLFAFAIFWRYCAVTAQRWRIAKTLAFVVGWAAAGVSALGVLLAIEATQYRALYDPRAVGFWSLLWALASGGVVLAWSIGFARLIWPGHDIQPSEPIAAATPIPPPES